MAASSSRRPGWLQLLRPPNLFSVPGDPLVGWALAVAVLTPSDRVDDIPVTALAAICAAAICLYLAGLISNDLADFAEDLRDRPDRPLPSGAVSKRSAWTGTVLLSIAGLALARLAGPDSLRVAAFVLALVMGYNFIAKRKRMTGAVTMGLCRACSVMMGAVIASKRPEDLSLLLTHFYGLLIYVALLTYAAEFETGRKTSPVVAGWLPFAVLALVLPAEYIAYSRPTVEWAQMGFIVLAPALAGCAFSISHRIHQQRRIHPGHVGQWIRLLIPWQAALLCLTDRPVWGLIVLALWPLAWLSAKRFYAS